MGRPQKNTAPYFPHFVQESRSRNILRSAFGNDGIATWWALMEVLAGSQGHFYDARSRGKWLYLVSCCNVSENIAEEIFNELAELGDIDKKLWDHRVLWCQGLVDNLAPLYRKRKNKLPEKPDISVFSGGETIVSGADTIAQGAEGENSTNTILTASPILSSVSGAETPISGGETIVSDAESTQSKKQKSTTKTTTASTKTKLSTKKEVRNGSPPAVAASFDLKKQKDALVRTLQGIGIGSQVSRKLVETYGPKRVQLEIERLAHAQKSPGFIKKNPAGWLRGSIEEPGGFQIPAGFVSTADRELAAKKRKKAASRKSARSSERKESSQEASADIAFSMLPQAERNIITAAALAKLQQENSFAYGLYLKGIRAGKKLEEITAVMEVLKPMRFELMQSELEVASKMELETREDLT